jgi:hypothetical protein
MKDQICSYQFNEEDSHFLLDHLRYRSKHVVEFLVNIISAIRTEPFRDALQVDTGHAQQFCHYQFHQGGRNPGFPIVT